MALTIGRAGKTLVLPEPTTWDTQNGLVTLTGYFQISPVTDAMRLRDQLLGYQDNWDEPIVPVTVGSEPRLTGYYRVNGVRITTDVEALNSGFVAYEVALQSVWGYAQPQFESIMTGALLTNAVGAVAADAYAFHVAPAACTEYVYFATPSTSGTRSSADGTLNLFATTGSVPSGSIRFYLTPANFYIGACTIEQGSPLQPVVGRSGLQNDTVNWRLSNGLVRVTANATAGKIDVSHWISASWSAVKTYKFTGTNRGLINAITAITILRNSTEECAIRLTCTGATGTPVPIFVDISLRRGDRLARIYITVNTTFNDTWAVFRNSVEAATAITYGAVTLGGFRATANDGDGNRYVLLSYQAATTSDLVNGGLTATGNGPMDVGIGSEVGGSGAAAIDTATNIAKQYIAAQSESQRIVAR